MAEITIMEDLTGRTFGRYRIESAVGQGGMAAVYKAYQLGIDRHVALKVLPPQFSKDPQFVKRFGQEARTLASLQHPHILPMYDYGSTDGFMYLVMPLVDGGDLDQLMRKERFSLDKIAQYYSQIGSALDYAHSQGIVHRDIKPSNILLNRQGYCLLSDFGLAKIAARNTRLTATGFVLGSAEYMSPEQGLGEQVDYRTDIYSMGVMLYQMTTGQVPFRGSSWSAVIIKAIDQPILPPSQLDPSIPKDLEAVILKACAKLPSARFSSMSEMVDALQKAASKGSTTLYPATLPAAHDAATFDPASDDLAFLESQANEVKAMFAEVAVDSKPPTDQPSNDSINEWLDRDSDATSYMPGSAISSRHSGNQPSSTEVIPESEVSNVRAQTGSPRPTPAGASPSTLGQTAVGDAGPDSRYHQQYESRPAAPPPSGYGSGVGSGIAPQPTSNAPWGIIITILVILALVVIGGVGTIVYLEAQEHSAEAESSETDDEDEPQQSAPAVVPANTVEPLPTLMDVSPTVQSTDAEEPTPIIDSAAEPVNAQNDGVENEPPPPTLPPPPPTQVVAPAEGSGGGDGRPPPQFSIDACVDLNVGDDCTAQPPGNVPAAAGICRNVPTGEVACVPEGAPPGSGQQP